MIEEMIDNIISAEEKAQTIIKESVNKSNEIVNDAHKQAAQLVEKAKDAQYESEQKAISKGEKDGEKRHTANLAKARKQAEEMPLAFETKKKEVTDCIIKELKSRYGNK